MSVDPAEVRRIAALARLRLDEEEARALTDDLNRILEHVDALGEVGEEPGAAGGDAPAPGTGVGPGSDGSSTGTDALASEPDPLLRDPGEGAPDFRDGFFTVPRLPGMSGEDEA